MLKLLDHAPAGTFPGRNFVTPEVLGYARCRIRSSVAWAELSKGPGILSDRPLYGVTFRRPGGVELWREEGEDPTGCFHSRTEAEARIAEYLEDDSST